LRRKNQRKVRNFFEIESLETSKNELIDQVNNLGVEGHSFFINEYHQRAKDVTWQEAVGAFKSKIRKI
jgi:hypothetical protein